MKQTFVAFVIAASLAACGKKETTTPVKSPAMEQKDDATGGARYGGRKAPEPDASKDPAPSAK